MNYKSGCIEGATKPPVRGAEYKIERSKASAMPGPVVSDGQAISPKSASIGGTRSVGAGGKKVSQTVNQSSHSRAWGLKG